jgi:hypothetical protein
MEVFKLKNSLPVAEIFLNSLCRKITGSLERNMEEGSKQTFGGRGSSP